MPWGFLRGMWMEGRKGSILASCLVQAISGLKTWRKKLKMHHCSKQATLARAKNFQMLYSFSNLSTRSNNLSSESSGCRLCLQMPLWVEGIIGTFNTLIPRSTMEVWAVLRSHHEIQQLCPMQLSVNVVGLLHAVKNLQPTGFKGIW